MTLLINPSLSYTELEIPLPSKDDLWRAETAEEWKIRMLSHDTRGSDILSVTDCLRFAVNHGSLPVEELNPSGLLFTLYGFWGLIWEYRQAHHMLRVGDLFCGLDGLSLTARFEALTKTLNVLRTVVNQIIGQRNFSPSSKILAELTTILEFNAMSLHTPLKTLPVFAGKDGEAEAHRVYPIAEQWTQSRDGRQAVWHAGQIFKSAKGLEGQLIRDFHAVAIYHACLVFWVYGMITGGRNEREGLFRNHSTQGVVVLDGDLSSDAKAFIAHGGRVPAIKDLDSQRHDPSTLPLLHKPARTMSVALKIFRLGASQSGLTCEEAAPIFVTALVQLISALGKAADTIGFS